MKKETNTVLILGAGSDIALALSEKFASNNHNLIFAARNVHRFEEAGKGLESKYGIQVSYKDFDALDFDSHSAFYESLPVKPDVIVVAFGYLGDKDLSRHDFKEAQRIIDTNFTGAVSILNIVADDLEKRQCGSIVGISSVAGERGRQSNYMYGSSKAAFSAYLEGLRNRLYASGVHVLNVKPGFVKTKMLKKESPEVVTASSEKAASDIFNAYKSGKNNLYTLWIWQYIMLIIKLIPNGIFKRMKL